MYVVDIIEKLSDKELVEMANKFMYELRNNVPDIITSQATNELIYKEMVLRLFKERVDEKGNTKTNGDYIDLMEKYTALKL